MRMYVPLHCLLKGTELFCALRPPEFCRQHAYSASRPAIDRRSPQSTFDVYLGFSELVANLPIAFLYLNKASG